MSYDNPEELNHDCNYNMFLAKNLLNNLKDVKDRQKAVKWMRKLSTCTESLAEMKLRNDFMYYLVINIQNYELKSPFNQEPPAGPLAEYQHLLPRGKECITPGQPMQDGEDEEEGQDQARPFLYQHSPDGGAFLASQPIPRCGAFCYLAVVSQSKE